MVLEVNRVNIVLRHSRLDRVQTPSQAEARPRTVELFERVSRGGAFR